MSSSHSGTVSIHRTARRIGRERQVDCERVRSMPSVRDALGLNGRLQHRKSKHLVLAGPFGGQVGETDNSHAVREPSINGRLDQVGREEGERDCHVDLARSATFASGDAFSRGTRLVRTPEAARSTGSSSLSDISACETDLAA